MPAGIPRREDKYPPQRRVKPIRLFHLFRASPIAGGMDVAQKLLVFLFLIPLSILRLLPHRVVLAIGKRTGYVAAFFFRKIHRVAEINLELAFKGAIPPEEVRRIVHESFGNFGSTVFEFLWSYGCSNEYIVSITKSPRSDEFESLLEEKRGAIVCSSHFSNWCWPALYCAARGAKVNVVVRPLDNPAMDLVMRRVFEKRGIRVIPRSDAAEEGAAALGRGEILGLMMDQNTVTGEMFVPFFGIPASTMRGMTVLQRVTDCHVVCAHDSRRGEKHSIHWSSPLALSGDDFESLTEVNRYFEKVISKSPGDYFWLHRRWKRRPEGEANFYEQVAA